MKQLRMFLFTRKIKLSTIVFLILLSASLTVTKNCYAQQSNLGIKAKPDTICPEQKDLRELVYNRDILIEQRNNLIERNNKLKGDFDKLNNAFYFAEKQINEMQQVDSSQQRIVQGLKDDKVTLQITIDNNTKQIHSLEKQLRHARSGTKWVVIVGLASIIGLLY